jgi:hypothetical protein
MKGLVNGCGYLIGHRRNELLASIEVSTHLDTHARLVDWLSCYTIFVLNLIDSHRV